MASFASSYIKTQASAVTRAEDALTYPGDVVNFPEGSVSFWGNVLYEDTSTEQAFVSAEQAVGGVQEIYVTQAQTPDTHFHLRNASDQTNLVAGTGAGVVGKSIVQTWDSATLTGYEDGAQVGSTATVAAPDEPAISILRIGAYSTIFQLFGHINTVKIYNRVLSAGEV